MDGWRRKRRRGCGSDAELEASCQPQTLLAVDSASASYFLMWRWSWGSSFVLGTQVGLTSREGWTEQAIQGGRVKRAESRRN